MKRAGAGALVLALALALAGCGGGGGSPGATGPTGGTTGTGGGTTPVAAPTVTVSLFNASGQAANTLTSAGSLTIKAVVLDKTGKPIPGAVVSFLADNKLVSLSTGSLLSDPSGVAVATMRVANIAAAGAGTVTVTATETVGGPVIATGSANYAVNATTLTFGALSANPAGLQAYGSTLLSVDVLSGTGKYTDQQVNVNFSSACVTAGKATLAPVVTTNGGTAQAVYRDQGCGNNDTVTATSTVIAKSATVGLQIAPPASASVQFVQAAPTNQSIVIKGQGGNGRTETASLTFKVVDIFNNPLPGAAVDFTSSTALVTVNKASDTTDQNGQIITTVNSGTAPTTFRVKAALRSDPNVFTWSDSIVVTTGLPVQQAFSLSAGKYQLDRTIESTPTSPATNINVMIGDNFGNPVPDGTPVVFQSNMGSVGSASKGGCITVNGGCTVDFRMQDPRVAIPNLPATPCNAAVADNPRAGVATVCSSTTDGTNTVFKKIELYFSGNAIGHAYLNGSSTPLTAGVIDLGSTSSSTPLVFTLMLTDSNDNPLPTGTTVSVANVVNASAQAPLPATVPNIAPFGTATQGSVHAFTISGSQSGSCTAPANATFNVVATTPAGNATYIPFKLTFSCP